MTKILGTFNHKDGGITFHELESDLFMISVFPNNAKEFDIYYESESQARAIFNRSTGRGIRDGYRGIQKPIEYLRGEMNYLARCESPYTELFDEPSDPSLSDTEYSHPVDGESSAI